MLREIDSDPIFEDLDEDEDGDVEAEGTVESEGGAEDAVPADEDSDDVSGSRKPKAAAQSD
jgi:hypothetical protein